MASIEPPLGEPTPRRIPRRAFLRRTAVAAAAGAVGFAPATADAVEQPGTSPDPLPGIVGVVVAAANDSLTVSAFGKGGRVVEVSLAEGAIVWRLGDARLADYEPGDDVLAYGSWVDEATFVATMVSCDLYTLEGVVRSAKGNVLETSAGSLRITHRTKPSEDLLSEGFRSLDASTITAVRAGMRVRGLVLRNQGNGGTAWHIGVR